MRTTNFTAIAVAAVVLAIPAAAQETERYTLHKTDQGYVRMDTRTGAISSCEDREGQLICRTAADERMAFHDEIDRLEARITALEKRLEALEGSPSAKLKTESPSEEEFEKALGYMERFFRRFMDIVRDLEKDFGTSEPEPDRTRM